MASEDSSSPVSFCAECGTPLPADGIEGIDSCPKCLLRAGLEAETVVTDSVSDSLKEVSMSDGRSPASDTQIGPYRLVSLIASGGMGDVFVAEQQQPVQRLVALKIVKAGMDSKEVLRRFEAERQALAIMEHPNVAHVYDAGTAPSGRPYFVMELVEGSHVTEYCDRQRLTTRQRLELFVKVCEAVHHAHQRGIIHRDLKPSNILVEEIDGIPTPKVIDFGIAKAMDSELTERTVETQFGDLLGTPQYMSPEQALGKACEIDTRSDVYSLGVILYELLTGELPISKEDIHDAGILGIGTLLLETQPLRPSHRFQSTGEEATTIASHRGTNSTQLRRSLLQDLDWITLKCIEREKERRYETANALVRDLRRHLNDDVVEARPPTIRYRVKKAVRRNRAAVIAGSLVLLAIVAGAGVAVWQAVEATVAHRETSKVLGETYAKTGWEKLEAGNASEALLWHTKAFQTASDSGALTEQDTLPYRQRIGWTLAQSPKPVAMIDSPHSVRPRDVWLDEKTGHVFLPVNDHGMQVWDLTSQTMVGESTAYKPRWDVMVDHVNRRFAFRGNTVSMFSFDDISTPIWRSTIEKQKGIYIFKADFSFDGKYYIALNNLLEVFTLDAATGEVLKKLDLGNGEKRDSPNLRVSDTDYQIATYSGSRDFVKGDRWLSIANAESGKITLPSIHRPDFSDTSDFSPDGKYFLLGENRGELHYVDLAKQEAAKSRMKFPTGNYPTRAFFNSTGTRVFSYNLGMINAWRWPAEEHLLYRRASRGLHLQPIREKYLLTGQGHEATLLDIEVGSVKSSYPELGELGEARFLGREGQWIVSARLVDKEQVDKRTVLTFWETESGIAWTEPIPLSGRQSSDSLYRIFSAAYDTPSNRFAILDSGGANVWEAGTGGLLYRYRNPETFSNSRSATLVDGGKSLAVSDGQNSIQVVELDTGFVSKTLKVEDSINELASSEDGTWLAGRELGTVESEDGSESKRGRIINFWEMPQGRLAHRLEIVSTNEWRSAIRFSPDGRFALALKEKPNPPSRSEIGLVLLDLDSGETWTYEEPEDRNISFDWNPGNTVSGIDRFAFADERTFVIGRTCWQIQAEGGLKLRGHLGHPEQSSKVTTVAQTGFVAVEDSLLRTFTVWNPESQTAVSEPVFHGSRILALAAHPNGRTIAVGDVKGQIRLYDWPSGKAVSPPLVVRDSQELGRLFFSREGDRLFAVNNEAEAVMWKIPPSPSLPPGDLSEIAYSLSRRHVNPSGLVVPISVDGMVERWKSDTHPDFTRDSFAPDGSVESDDWITLFDGKSLEGWENQTDDHRGFSIQRNLLKLQTSEGNSRALRYVGDETILPDFQDFIFRATFWGGRNAEGEIHVHSSIGNDSRPKGNHIVKINSRIGRTGSLREIEELYDFVARPESWHDLEIEVIGNQITTRIDGRPAARWDEPEDWKNQTGPNRALDRGTFVLRIDQGTIYLKDIQVKRLGDPLSPIQKSRVYTRLGQLRWSQENYEEARRLFRKSADLVANSDSSSWSMEASRILIASLQGMCDSQPTVEEFEWVGLQYGNLSATAKQWDRSSAEYLSTVCEFSRLSGILGKNHFEEGREADGVRFFDEALARITEALKGGTESPVGGRAAAWEALSKLGKEFLQKSDQVSSELLQALEFAADSEPATDELIEQLSFVATQGRDAGKKLFGAGTENQAINWVEKSLEARKRLLQAQPDNLDRVFNVENSWNNLAPMYLKVGREGEAVQARLDSFEGVWERLKHPRDSAHESALLRVAGGRVNAVLNLRDSLAEEDAIRMKEVVETLVSRLSKADFNELGIRSAVKSVSAALISLGHRIYDANQFDEAAEYYQRGILLSLQKIREVDSAEDREALWATAKDRLNWYRARKSAWDPDFFESAFHQYETIARTHGGQGSDDQVLANLLEIRGFIESDKGNLSESVELHRQAVSFSERSVGKLPEESRPVYELLEDYRTLGDVLRRATQRMEEETALQAASKVGERAIIRFPEEEVLHWGMGKIAGNQGRLCRETDRVVEAIAFNKVALTHFEKCIDLTPTTKERKTWASGILTDLGFLYRDEGRIPESEAAFRKAVTYREMALKLDPENRTEKIEVARCCDRLVGFLTTTDPENPEVRQLAERVVELLEPLSKRGGLTGSGEAELERAKQRLSE